MLGKNMTRPGARRVLWSLGKDKEVKRVKQGSTMSGKEVA